MDSPGSEEGRVTFGYSQRYTLIEARGPRRVSGLERLLERPTRRSHLKPHPLAGRGFSFLSFGPNLQTRAVEGVASLQQVPSERGGKFGN